MYILIVTGLSGAGKSQVLGILEDMGFVCADNMPCQLAKQYIELCSSSENNIERVALVIDSRESVFGYNPLNTYDELRRLECPYEIMFLECEDSVLVRRYSETRRRHPLMESGATIEDAVKRETELLRPLREHADFVIDTTLMPAAKLRNELYGLFGDKSARGKLSVNVVSFGFKYGIPLEADLVFDVRFLPNPYISRISAPTPVWKRRFAITCSARRRPASSWGTCTSWSITFCRCISARESGG